jgi:anti-sigma factor RsiW
MGTYERAMIELRDAQREVEEAVTQQVIAEAEGRRLSDESFDRAWRRREEAIAAICALVDGDDATGGGA